MPVYSVCVNVYSRRLCEFAGATGHAWRWSLVDTAGGLCQCPATKAPAPAVSERRRGRSRGSDHHGVTDRRWWRWRAEGGAGSVSSDDPLFGRLLRHQDQALLHLQHLLPGIKLDSC